MRNPSHSFPERDVHEIDDVVRCALVFAGRRMRHYGVRGQRTAEDYMLTALAGMQAHHGGLPELGPLCVEIDRLIGLDAEWTGDAGPVH